MITLRQFRRAIFDCKHDGGVTLYGGREYKARADEYAIGTVQIARINHNASVEVINNIWTLNIDTLRAYPLIGFYHDDDDIIVDAVITVRGSARRAIDIARYYRQQSIYAFDSGTVLPVM